MQTVRTEQKTLQITNVKIKVFIPNNKNYSLYLDYI